MPKDGRRTELIQDYQEAGCRYLATLACASGVEESAETVAAKADWDEADQALTAHEDK